MRVDFLLEGEEVGVGEDVAQAGGGHADASVGEGCAAYELYDVRQIGECLVVVLKHVLLPQCQIQQQVYHYVEILLKK